MKTRGVVYRRVPSCIFQSSFSRPPRPRVPTVRWPLRHARTHGAESRALAMCAERVDAERVQVFSAEIPLFVCASICEFAVVMRSGSSRGSTHEGAYNFFFSPALSTLYDCGFSSLIFAKKKAHKGRKFSRAKLRSALLPITDREVSVSFHSWRARSPFVFRLADKFIPRPGTDAFDIREEGRFDTRARARARSLSRSGDRFEFFSRPRCGQKNARAEKARVSIYYIYIPAHTTREIKCRSRGLFKTRRTLSNQVLQLNPNNDSCEKLDKSRGNACGIIIVIIIYGEIFLLF